MLSADQFTRMFGQLPTAYLVMTPDLVIREVNRTYLELLGRSRAELVGRHVFEAFPPTTDALDEDGINPLQRSFQRVRDSGRPDLMPLLKYDVHDPTSGTMQERHWSLVHSALQDDDGVVELILQRVEDVTDYVRERGARQEPYGPVEAQRPGESVEADLYGRVRQLKAAEASTAAALRALEVSEQRARAVLSTAADAIITVDAEGRVDSANPAAERMFGYSLRELVGHDVARLMFEPFVEDVTELDPAARTGARVRVDREVTGRRSDGTMFPIQLAVSEVGSQPPLFTGVLRDVTERKSLETRLIHASLHDPLTGLANRTLLVERLDLALTRLHRHPGTLALFFVDLDRFKLVNDTLGHDAGDLLLVQTAARLRSAVRPEDLVARLGGDEFIVLCADLDDRRHSQVVAQRLVAATSAPLFLDGREVFVTASVGVATDSTGGRGGEELLRQADAAMYRAKSQGRGRYIMLDGVSRARTGDRLQLTSELRHALDREEMVASYQPLVDLRTGEIIAAEALLRWRHPQRGLLAPDAFLDLASDMGIISDFDAWMMVTSCLRAARWADELARPMGVWVNLSSRSLADRRLRDTVVHALQTSRLDPALLSLEITEGGLMQDVPTTVRTLSGLRELGVQLAVDDFGTGYSSLSHLQQFPVHALKVDKSFVGRLDEPTPQAADDAAIVRTIVSLAQGLGLCTVAEGIETPDQLAAVTALGCDVGQGYYLGRPSPGETIALAARGGVTLVPGQRPARSRDLRPAGSPDPGPPR